MQVKSQVTEVTDLSRWPSPRHTDQREPPPLPNPTQGANTAEHPEFPGPLLGIFPHHNANAQKVDDQIDFAAADNLKLMLTLLDQL